MSEVALSIVLGIGLAAATGFRVFLPMLIVSGAAYTGHLPLGESFNWLGSPSALTMLSVAAIVEIAAYYIPGVDNLLDALATPAAFVAGTVVSAAVMTDVPPMVKWTAAVIAGGGIAGVTQGVTAALRANSTVWTGGLGNLIIATAELGRRIAGLVFSPGCAGRRNRPGHPIFMARDTSAPAVVTRSASVNPAEIGDTARADEVIE
jgi:Domain of unknown function (DUF4126)